VNHDNPHAWLDALRWVMTQPGLLEGLPGGHEPLLHPDDPRLHALLAVDTAGLMELLAAPRAHKLGIAFEALMLWGLEQGLGYRCIVRDVQIQDGKRTMGALDFILEAPDGTHEHWELAYKLFLQCDGGSEWSSWLGPRGRDRLDAKLNRMLTHQLPLSSTPQAIETLSALGRQAPTGHTGSSNRPRPLASTITDTRTGGSPPQQPLGLPRATVVVWPVAWTRGCGSSQQSAGPSRGNNAPGVCPAMEPTQRPRTRPRDPVFCGSRKLGRMTPR
jgi:hypothetical protein